MKITLTTIKSFIRRHPNVLHIKNLSYFDGMVDCVMSVDGAKFRPVKPAETNLDHNLGVAGAWFVKRSRDYFKPYKDDDFQGFEIFNSCGSFILAIPITQHPEGG
ncbi:unnamed protein product [marine sediment metagenome]|uniref:Uncharacterized protein n=1 Tax=marine sediment metagenome TaxID=412755 RepID=X1A2Z2_9ZZZZ